MKYMYRCAVSYPRVNIFYQLIIVSVFPQRHVTLLTFQLVF